MAQSERGLEQNKARRKSNGIESSMTLRRLALLSWHGWLCIAGHRQSAVSGRLFCSPTH